MEERKIEEVGKGSVEENGNKQKIGQKVDKREKGTTSDCQRGCPGEIFFDLFVSGDWI